ncbi:hypothetical protein GCM10010530_20940 [Kribbella aluminosa]|nr:hypothetical protein [Kribbella aluminosa]
MGSSPQANGGVLSRDLELPTVEEYAVPVKAPGAEDGEPTKVFGAFLRDAFRLIPDNLRLFGPDETASNRLTAVYEETGKRWLAERFDTDNHLAADGCWRSSASTPARAGWRDTC